MPRITAIDNSQFLLENVLSGKEVSDVKLWEMTLFLGLKLYLMDIYSYAVG